MRVNRVTSEAEFSDLRDIWNDLAGGNPFRSWEWSESWWRHYGRGWGRELFILCCRDPAGALVGIAPFFVSWSPLYGRTLRLLGSGEVCPEYLGLLCRPGAEEPVAAALAGWLMSDSCWPRGAWELLEIADVDAEEQSVLRLIDHLDARGGAVARWAGPNCWHLDLPDTWEAYLSGLSANERMNLRRCERRGFGAGKATLRWVTTEEDLGPALGVLIALHQKRRQSLGDTGSFAEARFGGFLRDVTRRLLRSGQLWLSLVDIDGRTVCAEYSLLGERAVYFYLSGIEPAALELAPGRLSKIAALKRAIAEGFKVYDFLRGDEPYKARYGPRPRPGLRALVSHRALPARLRLHALVIGRAARHWLRALRARGANGAVP